MGKLCLRTWERRAQLLATTPATTQRHHEEGNQSNSLIPSTGKRPCCVEKKTVGLAKDAGGIFAATSSESTAYFCLPTMHPHNKIFPCYHLQQLHRAALLNALLLLQGAPPTVVIYGCLPSWHTLHTISPCSWTACRF